jgi:hypothetical protein
VACRGVLLAVTSDEMSQLLKAPDDEHLMEVFRQLDEQYLDDHCCELQKAWDAMHRCLADGTLDWTGGSHPLNKTILGTESLHKEDDYIICVKDPIWVKEIARALMPLTKDWLQKCYEAMDDDYLGWEWTDSDRKEDFEITWGFLEEARKFYGAAAQEGRAVVFKVDQ